MDKSDGDESDGDVRIRKTLARAKAETGVADVAVFGLARVWIGLLLLGSLLFKLFHNKKPSQPSGPAAT